MTRFLARSFTILALSMISSSVFAAGDIDCRLYGATVTISYAPHIPNGASMGVSSAHIPSETVTLSFNNGIMGASTEQQCVESAKQVALQAASKKSKYTSSFVTTSYAVNTVTVSYIGAKQNRVTFDTRPQAQYVPSKSSKSSGEGTSVSTRGRF